MRATILCPLVLFCLSLPAAADVTVASPDGRVRFVLSSGAQGHLEYTVTFNSKNIVDPSPLGIVVDGVDLAGGAQISEAETYKINETYPWYGPHSTAIDNCNGARDRAQRARRSLRISEGPPAARWPPHPVPRHALARYRRPSGPQGGARHAFRQRLALHRPTFRRGFRRHAQEVAAPDGLAACPARWENTWSKCNQGSGPSSVVPN